MHWMPWSICALLVLGGCSSKPCCERGWIGGSVKPVARCGTWCRNPPAYGADGVYGMPQGVDTPRGLLVTRVPPSSPAQNAGLLESDLILAIDGRPVADPVSFREAVETRAPGDTLQLDVWRQGRRVIVPVVVGRERYRREAVVAVYLPVPTNLALDLWPFDDGFDVLGLVSARANDDRRDLASAERVYLRTAVPGEEAPVVRQETVDVRVFPLAAGTGVKVHSQEAVPASVRGS